MSSKSSGYSILSTRQEIALKIEDYLSQNHINSRKFASQHFEELDYGSPKTLIFYLSNWRQGRHFGYCTDWGRIASFNPCEADQLSKLLTFMNVGDNDPIFEKIKSLTDKKSRIVEKVEPLPLMRE